LLVAIGSLFGLAAGALAIETRLRGLSLRLAGGALGGLGLPAGALRCLGGAARLACSSQIAIGGSLEPQPGPGLLLAAPEGGEAIAEQLAASLEVDSEHVEPAVSSAVWCVGRQPGIEVGSPPRSLSNGRRIGSLQLLEVLANPGQHHVAVVDLAEDVLQIAGAPPGGVGGATEAEAGHLEHVAEPLRRDPHVVLGLRLPVERTRREGEHLIKPNLDDPGSVLPEGA